MSARTLFDKVWSAHQVVPETADTPAVLYIDLHLIHEVTSPQAFSVLRSLELPVRRPDRTLATMDHSTPTSTDQVFGAEPIRVDAAAKQVRQLETNAAEFGVELFAMRDARRGIVHVNQPGTRRHPARHDHRVRRQPHQHAWRFWGPGVRDRHQRGRATSWPHSALWQATSPTKPWRVERRPARLQSGPRAAKDYHPGHHPQDWHGAGANRLT